MDDINDPLMRYPFYVKALEFYNHVIDEIIALLTANIKTLERKSGRQPG